MIRSSALAATLFLLFSSATFAQTSNPRLDLFGGYSHVGNYGIGLNGWIGSANWHLFKFIGLEGDLSGEYGSIGAGEVLSNTPNHINSRMHSFDVGPNGMYRPASGKYDAFGHLLFGFSHTNVNAAGVGNGDTAFSWALGGGADYNFASMWAARVQLDYLRTNFFGSGQNHARVALGLVYHFGKSGGTE